MCECVCVRVYVCGVCVCVCKRALGKIIAILTYLNLCLTEQDTTRSKKGEKNLLFCHSHSKVYNIIHWILCFQVYATMPDQLRLEQADPDKLAEHIKDLAHQLYLNVGRHVLPLMIFSSRADTEAESQTLQLIKAKASISVLI